MMNNKMLTKDSITGAVFRCSAAAWGHHWTDAEEVVSVTLTSDVHNCASHHMVMDLGTAYELKHQLDRCLSMQMRHWAKNQLVNHPQFQ